MGVGIEAVGVVVPQRDRLGATLADEVDDILVYIFVWLVGVSQQFRGKLLFSPQSGVDDQESCVDVHVGRMPDLFAILTNIAVRPGVDAGDQLVAPE